jgi:probable phosphoglycerate mutase
MNDWVGNRLAGWLPDVHLNEQGRAQSARLAERLAGSGIAAVVSSPLDRARETAEPLARRLGVDVQISEALGEIRCGEWTERRIADLDAHDPLWQRFNVFRGGTRAPGGELMIETQTRMVNELLRLRRRYGAEKVACVSHGDPLRAVLGYFLGSPMDLFARIEVSPASISVLRLHDWGAQVLSLNETAHLDGPGASFQV